MLNVCWCKFINTFLVYMKSYQPFKQVHVHSSLNVVRQRDFGANK